MHARMRNAQHLILNARIAIQQNIQIQSPRCITNTALTSECALNALQFHPEFYTVAVAYNGCYDNRMDKLSWNEQWMGWPVDDSYARASGVDNADKLRGQLLLIVGEQDENVDPASTYQVADALIRAGKDFDLLTVPGTGHGVGRSQEPIDYIQRRKFDFFVRHLRGLATPDWNQKASP